MRRDSRLVPGPRATVTFRAPAPSPAAVRIAALLALQLSLLALGGCRPDRGPRPLRVGEDSCDYCRMAISDVRFGAQVRMTTGRVVTFDAVECLAGYIHAAGDSTRFAGVWVADYLGAGMVGADSAHFVSGGTLHSPMGRQLTSFAPGIDADTLSARYGGTVLTWREVLALASAAPVTSPGAADAPSSTAHAH
jgi:copper chaperone NosL